MENFAAIDFETANFERSSVCSVGVVIVRDGEITDSFYSLIQPEPNYYNYRCMQVHGLRTCFSGSVGTNRAIDRRIATCGTQQSI